MEQEIDIKNFRMKRGWSQIQLAQHLGVNRSTVSRLEAAGKARGPTLRLLQRLFFEQNNNSLADDEKSCGPSS